MAQGSRACAEALAHSPDAFVPGKGIVWVQLGQISMHDVLCVEEREISSKN